MLLPVQTSDGQTLKVGAQVTVIAGVKGSMASTRPIHLPASLLYRSCYIGRVGTDSAMVLFSQCTEQCGWVAAVLAALSWGSFGVPIKAIPSAGIQVDALVLQSYKTIMCFLTCWLIIPMGEPYSFTPWGIVSGIFWVPGAACGIYAIRTAGLAISVGTWSSLIVVSSFCWGIGVFHEGVKSVPGAFCAMLLLCAGLGGMSRYSHDQHSAATRGEVKTLDEETVPLTLPKDDEDESAKADQLKKRKPAAPQSIDTDVERIPGSKSVTEPQAKVHASPAPPAHPLEFESLIAVDGVKKDGYDPDPAIDKDGIGGSKVVLFRGRIVLTKRQLGILGAVVNGTWGGTNLVPLHYAKKEGYGGAAYVISFACGSMLVLVVVWLLRYFYNLYRFNCSHREAWEALPSFHLRQMGLPSALAGALYSVGNFSSIIATTYLGQGVGYSVCQSAMLVSGIWGIFFFGEVQGAKQICKWFCAAFVALIGILWLSYEHKGESAH